MNTICGSESKQSSSLVNAGKCFEPMPCFSVGVQVKEGAEVVGDPLGVGDDDIILTRATNVKQAQVWAGPMCPVPTFPVVCGLSGIAVEISNAAAIVASKECAIFDDGCVVATWGIRN